MCKLNTSLYSKKGKDVLNRNKIKGHQVLNELNTKTISIQTNSIKDP